MLAYTFGVDYDELKVRGFPREVTEGFYQFFRIASSAPLQILRERERERERERVGVWVCAYVCVLVCVCECACVCVCDLAPRVRHSISNSEGNLKQT